MCVCVCVCVCVCACVHGCVCVSVSAHACVCLCTLECVNTCMCVCLGRDVSQRSLILQRESLRGNVVLHTLVTSVFGISFACTRERRTSISHRPLKVLYHHVGGSHG